MILWYAAGGGLGHLVRARIAAAALRLEGPVTLLTDSPFAADPRVRGGWEVEPLPRAAGAGRGAGDPWAAPVRDAMARVRPRLVVLDAFPGGLRGEWCGFHPGVPVLHLARRLRWKEYARTLRGGAPPRIERVLRLEPLEGVHERALRAVAGSIDDLDLRCAPVDGPPRERRPRPLWLVVHAGPPDEVATLVAYARDVAAAEGVRPRIERVVPDDAGRLAVFPAAPRFPAADRVFTGCGFNAMREGAALGERHRFLPFPRRYDDQPWRAARRRAERAAAAQAAATP